MHHSGGSVVADESSHLIPIPRPCSLVAGHHVQPAAPGHPKSSCPKKALESPNSEALKTNVSLHAEFWRVCKNSGDGRYRGVGLAPWEPCSKGTASGPAQVMKDGSVGWLRFVLNVCLASVPRDHRPMRRHRDWNPRQGLSESEC